MPRKVKVLVADDELTIAEIVAFIFENACKAEVKTVTNGVQAISALDADSFDLVVCDYNMPQKNGGDVFMHIQKMAKKPHYALMSSDRPVDHKEFSQGEMAGHIEKPFSKKTLVDLFAKLFPAGVIEEAAPPQPAQEQAGIYCRIRPILLHALNVLPCDLYIQLSSKKFVKLMNTGDVFGNGDLQRIESKGVPYLFVQSEKAQEIMSKLVQQLNAMATIEISKSSSNGHLTLSEAMQATIHDLAEGLGFSPALEEGVKANMSLVMSTIARNKDLSALLQGISLKSGHYASMHSILLPYISCHIAELMDWHSEQTFQKLTFASLLHDCTISDSDLAQVQTEEELKEYFAAPADQKKWWEHMGQASEIARRFSEIPSDVDIIVGQHHELPDGTGFPNHLPHTRIAPLAALFIVAHDFLLFFDKTNQINVPAFVAEKQEKYDQGQFKKILAALAKSKAAS